MVRRLAVVLKVAIGFSAGLFSQSQLDRLEHVGGPLGEIMRKNLDGKQELSRYDRLNRSAVESIAIREYKEAFQRLKEALELDPQAPDAYINFGMAHYERGEYPSSENAIAEALKRDPENARAWYWHSKIMLVKGEIQDAHEAASRSVAFSNAEEWTYLDWQAILLYDQGHFEKAIDVSALAYARIKQAFSAVDQGIRQEESEIEVSGLEEDVEIVRDIGGGMREVPVTRIRTDYKMAPDKWYRLKSQLEDSMGSVAFRHAMSLLKAGREADFQSEFKAGFLYDHGNVRRGQYHLAMMDYQQSAELLKRPVERGGTGISALIGYVIDLVALNDHAGVKRVVRKAKNRIRKEKAHWAADALKYVSQYAPEAKIGGLPAVSELDDAGRSRSAFYKAQLHLSQERLDLARPWLEKAVGSLFDTSFEAKAAEAQLELFFKG